VISEFKLY
jgi:hypothetical protein